MKNVVKWLVIVLVTVGAAAPYVQSAFRQATALVSITRLASACYQKTIDSVKAGHGWKLMPDGAVTNAQLGLTIKPITSDDGRPAKTVAVAATNSAVGLPTLTSDDHALLLEAVNQFTERVRTEELERRFIPTDTNTARSEAKIEKKHLPVTLPKPVPVAESIPSPAEAFVP